MFDIFNKKKNKELQEQIYNYEQEIKSLKDQLAYAKYEAIKDTDKETINRLMEQNEKMTNWIYNILKEFGTMNTKEKHINIPIYDHTETYFGYVDQQDRFKKVYIEIPSITLIKQKRI